MYNKKNLKLLKRY